MKILKYLGLNKMKQESVYRMRLHNLVELRNN